MFSSNLDVKIVLANNLPISASISDFSPREQNGNFRNFCFIQKKIIMNKLNYRYSLVLHNNELSVLYSMDVLHNKRKGYALKLYVTGNICQLIFINVYRRYAYRDWRETDGWMR